MVVVPTPECTAGPRVPLPEANSEVDPQMSSDIKNQLNGLSPDPRSSQKEGSAG